MKKTLKIILLAALFLAVTATFGVLAAEKVSRYALETNAEKVARVKARLDETTALLTELSRDEYIYNMQVSFEEKAQFLTDKNRDEGLGYMMLRILDEDVNIYKEGLGLASNLGSRDYMQRLYSTGETQVTDAFLAGADGTTINYTVAAIIKPGDQVQGALMAAIYGAEIDEVLIDDNACNVLVGSQLQYMGGVSREQFGLSVEQVMETELRTSRPLERILSDFTQRRSGGFWGVGDGVQYIVYAPVPGYSWSVMTQVHPLPLIGPILLTYAAAVAVLAVLALLAFRKKRPRA